MSTSTKHTRRIDVSTSGKTYITEPGKTTGRRSIAEVYDREACERLLRDAAAALEMYEALGHLIWTYECDGGDYHENPQGVRYSPAECPNCIGRAALEKAEGK